MRFYTVLTVVTAIAMCGGARGAAFSGKVTELIRPDLLKIERDGAPYEVRVYGADAPEPGQPFADEALAFAKSSVLNQSVTVEGLATDSLGKIVGAITLPDGTDYATALVTGGLAWWDEKNAPEAKALQSANVKALLGKTGIFKEPAALAPWDYRKSHGGEAYTYTTKPVEAKTAEKAPIEMKLKGDMTTDTPVTGIPGLPPGVEVPKDAMALIDKHKPHIAKDAAGNGIGITADDIADIPFAAAFGLQNGDIITGVNGINIRSEIDVMSAIPQLKGKKDFKVSINRGGKVIEIPINVP